MLPQHWWAVRFCENENSDIHPRPRIYALLYFFNFSQVFGWIWPPSQWMAHSGLQHVRNRPGKLSMRNTNVLYPLSELVHYYSQLYALWSDMEVEWLLGQWTCLWIEGSGFKPWPGTLSCGFRQNSLLSQCLSPPRYVNEYQWPKCPHSWESWNTHSLFMLQKPSYMY